MYTTDKDRQCKYNSDEAMVSVVTCPIFSLVMSCPESPSIPAPDTMRAAAAGAEHLSRCQTAECCEDVGMRTGD